MADVVPRADEIAARHAYEVQGRIKETQRRIKEAWIDLARDLYEFSSDRLWKDLGYGSFEEWAADPDIDIGRRWAYELITLYKSLVIQHEIAPERLVAIAPAKLQEVMPALRRRQISVEEALSDAQTLSVADIRDRYRGHAATKTSKGSAPDIGTSYEALHEPQFVRCPTCGSRVRPEEIHEHSL
jgi:hypothetical protein